MKPIAFTLLAMAAHCGSAWSAATPPPTSVRTSEVRAVDALTGSFVLEWNPALAPDGRL